MKVRLELSVSENALPALVNVKDSDGRLILCKKVNRKRNVLCFCVKNGNFSVAVRPFSADFYRQTYYIKARRCGCFSIRLNFVFTERETIALQTFTLFDRNYNFAIENAELLFFGNG